MAKKLTRSKRKELRAKGDLKVPLRLVETRKAEERQAEEREVGARIHEAREAIAHREEEPGHDEPADAPAPKEKKRDLTLLWLAAIIGVAGLIYWLTQRPPAGADAPKPVATSEHAPIIITAPAPPRPPPAEPPAAAAPHPAPAPSVTTSPAPSVTTSPVPSVTTSPAPAAATATSKAKAAPADAPKPRPAPAKPKADNSDPYG